MNSVRDRSESISTYIDRAVKAPQQQLRQSRLGHHAALDELRKVWDECRVANWDGYDALPVSQGTYEAAYRLIDSLPLGFPSPAIGAEPDGDVTLEWRKSRTRTLSVSVSANGYLHYAGLFGLGQRYGTLSHFADAPEELIRLVQDL
ncbi:MAG: hypothetical protein JSS02_15430 [Planctomycetes bacterium]|nr:hypothetical protein [Planctomycetota bacterium]